MDTMRNKPIVRMKGIGKCFGKVRVLQDVSFDVYPGEVHALVGENGAGKSTLIKILSGVHTDYEGQLFLGGREVRPKSPLEANKLGISVIYQELSLIGSMSISDNMFLGRAVAKGCFVDDDEQNDRAKGYLEQVGLSLDPKSLVENQSISAQQLIEIAKALSLKAKVIVMDEPTSALNKRDAEILFGLIDKLKAEGCGIVYVSHKMDEITRLGDRITVLRDGKWIGSDISENLPMKKMIHWMVGRELNNEIPFEPSASDSVRFSVENLSIYDNELAGKKLVDGVSLHVREGEVLGIAGLQGSGASELLKGIFGCYEIEAAKKLTLDGKQLRIQRPVDAIDNGIAFLTNDRKANGIVPEMSIIGNVVLAKLKDMTRLGWRSFDAERSLAMDIGKTLRFVVPSYDSPIADLSGGNQQKVILGKWLVTQPKVLLLDEPTRGIDIGAKHEIYGLINELKKQGISIIMITSEMPELISLCDRIMVMHRGLVSGELIREEFDSEKILSYAMGMEE